MLALAGSGYIDLPTPDYIGCSMTALAMICVKSVLVSNYYFSIISISFQKISNFQQPSSLLHKDILFYWTLNELAIFMIYFISSW